MAGTPGTPRVLRAMNDRAALDLLLEHGTLSRTRIGKLTGLSKPTASQLLARLEAAGLVLATGTTAGRPGPNAQLYSVNPAAAYVAGLDVKTERIRAAVADITGRTVGDFRLPTPSHRAGSAVEHVLRALEGAVKAAGLNRSDLHRLVIGTPGAFDPSTGRLRYASHLPGWHSPSLLDELAAALPMPLEYDNDVNLAAVAEQRIGAARGHGDFALLWNEEGIGAAFVIGGKLHRGWTGGAGEVGFLPVPGTPWSATSSRRTTAASRSWPGATRCCGPPVNWASTSPRAAWRTPRPRCCAARPRTTRRRRVRTAAGNPPVPTPSCSPAAPPATPSAWPRSSRCSTRS